MMIPFKIPLDLDVLILFRLFELLKSLTSKNSKLINILYTTRYHDISIHNNLINTYYYQEYQNHMVYCEMLLNKIKIFLKLNYKKVCLNIY